MKSSTKQILTVMQIIFWVLFVGTCITTGAILYSFIVSLYINPLGAKNLYLGLNLSDLYQTSIRHYTLVVLLIIFLSGIKSYFLYLVTKIFIIVNFYQPFSQKVYELISKISLIALAIGVVSLIANKYCDWLNDVVGKPLTSLNPYLGGAGEFLLLGGIVFVIALVFKRGIEIQSENELTV